MESQTTGCDGAVPNRVFTALADARRRATLRLLDRHSTLTPDELATRLAAELEDVRSVDVSSSRSESLRHELHHVHLPKLEAAGLLRRREEELVPTRHPALEDPKIRRMIESVEEDWDPLLTALADERRRIALAVLYRHDGPMDRTDLAAAIARKLRDGGSDGSEEADVLIQLHHVHLPRLEDATLVSYDPDAKTVSYEGHRGVGEEWLVDGPDDTPRAIPSVTRHAEDIWAL